MNMTENKIVANNGSSIVLYTTDDGNTQLEVKLEKDTVWLTQNQMAELFGRDRTVISRHIRNIFKEGELDENITCAKFAHMGTDQDQTYETKMYSLDVIISVGYRVKSINGTKFRIWHARSCGSSVSGLQVIPAGGTRFCLHLPRSHRHRGIRQTWITLFRPTGSRCRWSCGHQECR